MDFERVGNYLDIAENVLTAGSVIGGLYSGLQSLRGERKRARDEFERPSPKRARLIGGNPRYHGNMPAMRRRFKKTRRSARRQGYKRGMGVSTKRIVRNSTITSVSIVAAASTFFATLPKLSDVLTSDLISAYRLFRIAKVVVHVVPRIDPANSGLANNYQAYVAAACDNEDATAPTSIQQITAYDNSYSKWVVAGDRFTYTFYPKAVNVVGNAGASAYVGSYSTNPWLQLNAAGTALPHNSLKMGIQYGTSTSTTFDIVYEYHFDVKGLA